MGFLFQARYKLSLDPTVDDVKKLCTSLRRNAKVATYFTIEGVFLCLIKDIFAGYHFQIRRISFDNILYRANY